MSALFAGSEEREVPIVSQIRIYEFTRYQTKYWALEELHKKYASSEESVGDWCGFE